MACGERSLVGDARSSYEAQYVLRLTPSIAEARTANEAGSLVGDL